MAHHDTSERRRTLTPPCSTAHLPSTTSKTQTPTAHASSNAQPTTSSPATKKTYTPTSSPAHGSSAYATTQPKAHSPNGSDTPSPAKPSTGNANATDEQPGNTTATPTTAPDPHSYPSTIPPTLSTQNLWTITYIAEPMSNGYNEKEIAHQLGLTTRQVKDKLQHLRDEIRGGGQHHEDT